MITYRKKYQGNLPNKNLLLDCITDKSELTIPSMRSIRNKKPLHLQPHHLKKVENTTKPRSFKFKIKNNKLMRKETINKSNNSEKTPKRVINNKKNDLGSETPFKHNENSSILNTSSVIIKRRLSMNSANAHDDMFKDFSSDESSKTMANYDTTKINDSEKKALLIKLKGKKYQK